jgi:hypothetical protein
MNRALSAVGLTALCLAWVASAAAQPTDHLACYKIKDSQAKATYTANVGGLAAEPGCIIKVPATMACVPATKTNVQPMPPGGGGTGTPNSFFCYKVKCPKATLPTLAGADQFGSRTVTPKTTSLLCAPLAGPTLRFVDNGDGTVTDHQTGLQWEKKEFGQCSVCGPGTCPCITNTDCPGSSCLGGCPHCVNDTYAWSNSGSAPDGPAFTSFLGTLNNCTSSDGSAVTPAFAGHCDWRLPGIAELKTIVDLSAPGCGSGSACIDPIFGPTATASLYWSSTIIGPGNPNFAWYVAFSSGFVSNDFKRDNPFSVRAVRGGS